MKFHSAEVIGHRGVRGLATENTREGFQLAKALGLKWIETDLRMTRDQTIVLHHDRMLGSLAIDQHDFKTLQNEAEGSLLTMKELLVEFAGDFVFNLELKDPQCFEGALEEIKHQNLRDQVLFSSFFHPVVLKGKQMAPELKFAPLTASRPADIKAFLSSFKSLDGLVADADFIDQAFVSSVIEAGLEMYLYNVHDPIRAAHWIHQGIKGIIVDHPPLFVEESPPTSQ